MVELIMLVFDDEKAHERGLIYTRRSDKFVRQNHVRCLLAMLIWGLKFVDEAKFENKRR